MLASSFEVEILLPVSPSEAGPDSAEGGNDVEGAAAPSVEINDALFCQGHLKEIVSVSRLHLGVNDKLLLMCY